MAYQMDDGTGPETTKKVPMYLMGLQLVFHGGQCCGIKTVYHFSWKPDQPVPPLKKIPQNNADQCGQWVSSTTRFFHDEAPQETCLERLDRYIEYMKRRRPANILEAVLTDDQMENWREVMEERGFKVVTSGRNSNSGNVCNILHLVIDEWEDGDEDEDFDD